MKTKAVFICLLAPWHLPFLQVKKVSWKKYGELKVKYL